MSGFLHLNRLLCRNLKSLTKNPNYLNIIKEFKPKLSNSNKTQQSKLYLNEYECVYQFRYIKQLRLLSRLKIYQTGFAILFGVSSVVLYDMEILNDINQLIAINGSMIFALLMLLLISRQTVKIVGRLYLNQSQNKVLISHLNFLGKRRDMIFNLEDIQPISSLNELKDTFLKLNIKNMDGSMTLVLPYGQVFNKDGFLKVLRAK